MPASDLVRPWPPDLVNSDIYKVRNGKVIDKKISTKKLAIYASKDGSTKEQETPPERQNRQALTGEQILSLTHLGRKSGLVFGRKDGIWMKYSIYKDNLNRIKELFEDINDSVGTQRKCTEKMCWL